MDGKGKMLEAYISNRLWVNLSAYIDVWKSKAVPISS